MQHAQSQATMASELDCCQAELEKSEDELSLLRAQVTALKEQLSIEAQVKDELVTRTKVAENAAALAEVGLRNERLQKCEQLLWERQEQMRCLQNSLEHAEQQRVALESTVGHLININDDLHMKVQEVCNPIRHLEHNYCGIHFYSDCCVPCSRCCVVLVACLRIAASN
jgi:(p)ppGpp synthase/HD superfamily hydrolase